MENDYIMIVKKLPETVPHANLYPIGDPQVGSARFNESLFRAWRDRVLDDKDGYVVILGDMLNNGIKNSKTNSYNERLSPSKAKAWLTKELEPITDRILGGVTGNHELRSDHDVDDDPLYDVMDKLGIADLYRKNMAFIKLNLGKNRIGKQVSYGIVLAHGVSKTKTDKFTLAVDNVDIFLSGHTHDANSKFPAKIVMDMQNEVVRTVGYTHLVVPSFDLYGGYALRGLYVPQDGTKVPILTLSGIKKKVDVHWIQEEFS